ncbi:cytochrome P450 [Lactarius psammicola]|nr:cytochrome P450 [Lactarius psammicola]
MHALISFLGNVFYLYAAGQPIVVLNNQKVAANLLNRCAVICSDPPPNIVAAHILCGSLAIVHQFLTIFGSSRRPRRLRRIRRVAHEVSELESGVKAVNDFVAHLTRAALPGAHFEEFFPSMRHIPKQCWYEIDLAMFESLLKSAREKLHRTPCPSLVEILIKDAEKYGLSERENPWVAVIMYAADAETASAVLAWWMPAMTMYPEVQMRAQAGLDGAHLPYIRTIVREALRWQRVDLVGLPHLSTEDDRYDDVFIPKDTIMMANALPLRPGKVFGQ